MTSHKCPNCGLVSFVTAANCKRCQASLKVSGEEAQAATSFEAYEIDDAKPGSSFSPLRVLLLILLLAIPGWLYYRSQEQAIVVQQEQQKKLEQEEWQRRNEEAFGR
jgi:hypothetical protein